MKDENGNSANFAFKAKSAKYTDSWEEYSGNFPTVDDAKKWYFDSQRGGMLRQLFNKELALFFRGKKFKVNWINNEGN